MTLPLLLLAGAVYAQSPESIRADAASIFFGSLQNPPSAPAIQPDGRAELDQFLEKLVTSPAAGAPLANIKEPASFMRLEDVRNNYWRTSASFPLNGRTTTVSFVVGRNAQAYLTVLGQGDRAPQWVNVRRLLGDDKSLAINGKSYRISLSPDIFDKLGSKVHISGNGEDRSYSLRDLINAAFPQGFSFPIAKREFRVFYYDDVTDNGGIGSMDAGNQNITFVARDKDDFNIYIMHSEDVPEGQIGVFPLGNSAKAGLQKLDGGNTLGMYPNP